MNVHALLFFVSVALSALPSVASACKCATPRIDSSTPADGATDVPINAAILIHGAIFNPEVTWTAADGTPVAFDVHRGISRLCAHSLELVPRTALVANSVYLVSIEHNRDEPLQLRFTTGSAALPLRPLAPPRAVVSFIRATTYRNSCQTPLLGCADVGDVDTELVMRDAHGAELQRTFVRGNALIESVPKEVACIEVRSRDATGQRSQPLELCGAELNRRDALLSDYRAPERNPLCRDGRFGDDALHDVDVGEVESAAASSEGDGCALGGTRMAAAAWPLLALIAMFRRRRSGR